MGAFTVYMFSAGVYLLAGYLVYKWLLADDNQPAFNRVVLLSIYVVSFVLPFWRNALPLSPGVGMAMADAVGTRIVAAGVTDPMSSAVAVVLWVYMAGMIVVAAVALGTMFRLLLLIVRGERTRMGRFTLVVVSGSALAPFSWGRYVVVDRAEDFAMMDMIVSHECSHIRLRHFYDLLLAQAVCIVQWYNPAAWLMLSELKAVHEYQADRAVLADGMDMRRYQLLLIKKTVGFRFQSLANSLNHSNLKKRITMMYKKESGPVRRLRALAAVPAAALAMALLNVPVVSRAMSEVSSATFASGIPAAQSDKVTEFVAKPQVSENLDAVDENGSGEKPDVLPVYPGGIPSLMQALCGAINYPADAYAAKIEGRVVVGFTVTAAGEMTDFKIVKSVSPELDAEAIRALKSLKVTWTPARKDGKPVNCAFALPVEYKLR